MKKTIVWSVVVIILLPFVGCLVKTLWFPAMVANTAIDSAAGILKTTLDSDNVIYNYEWFKLTYEQVEAYRQKLATAEQSASQFKEDAGPRTGWDFSDKDEFARLNTTKMGLSNMLKDTIAVYNARAKMMNRSFFKGKLPSEIVE